MRPVKSEDGERFSRGGQRKHSTDSNGEMMEKEDCSHPDRQFMEPNAENKERAKYFLKNNYYKAKNKKDNERVKKNSALAHCVKG